LDNVRQGTGSGTGTSTSTEALTPVRTATGIGTSSFDATWLRIVPKTANGSGGATAGDTANWLITQGRAATGFGLSLSSVVVVRELHRNASGSGTSGSSAIRGHTHIRTTASGGAGSLDVALWKNAGEYMDRIIRMRPVQGPGFRRKVNYSVKR
jgi:hypothetical protein